MITIHQLTKKFGKCTALNNVSASLNKGQCIALIGPNGSGKTTLVKSILGMTLPDSGYIDFDGQNILRDWHYRAQIGYMPQIGRYPENMTIGQVINMMKDIRSEKGNKASKAKKKKKGKGEISSYMLDYGTGKDLDEDLLWDFDILNLFGKRMRTLSGGTTQKVSASLAFLFNPDVLILDEPTAGLDPLAAEILKDKIVQEKKKGKLIIITSHILSDLDDLITHVMYMQEGNLLFYKDIDWLRKDTGEMKLSRAIAAIMKQNAHNE